MASRFGEFIGLAAKGVLGSSGSSSSTSLYVDPNAAASNPSQTQANLLDAQRTDFENRYIPIEEEIAASLEKDGETEAQKAGDDVARSHQLSRGEFMRNLSRTNTQLTGRQRRQIDRSSGLAQARNIAHAENTMRANIKDENFQRKADFIGIGKDIATGANQGLSSAASMQTQRENAYEQAKAQRKAQNMNTLATVGGLGIGAAIAFGWL